MPSYPVEEALLREPNLWVPGKKPVGSVKIDWSNELAPRLGVWLLGDNATVIRSLVDHEQNPIQGVGRGIDVGKNGRYYYYSIRDVITYDSRIDVDQIYSTSGSYTFEWIAEYPATYADMAGTNEYCYMFDIQTDRFIIASDTTFDPNLGFYDGVWTSTGYNPCGSGYQHMIFVFDGTAGTATLYSNGVQKYSAATYTARNFTSKNGCWLGRYVQSGANFHPKDLHVYYLSIHDSALTPGQVAVRTADPYQFLIPA